MLGKCNLVFDDPVQVILPGKLVKMKLVDINADNYPDWIISCTNNIVAVALNKKEAGNVPVNDMRLYPNPSGGWVYIEGLNNEQYDARIYNLPGSLVKQFKITGPSASIDVKHLPQGLYFLVIKSRKQRLVRKLVKQ